MVDVPIERDLFRHVVPFVAIAEEQSFRRAAVRLGVTPAAVSKALATLEAELGVQLVARTSRSVALTPEGALFLERCRAAVVAVQVGRDEISGAQRVAQGELRLSVPFVLGRRVTAALPTLLERHPRLRVRVELTDRRARLVEEGIDVAVRIGPLERTSTLIARRLASPRWTIVASPAYLARHGTPASADELAQHAWARFVMPEGAPRDPVIEGPDGSVRTVAVQGGVLVDQGELLVETALAGLGLAQVFDFMVDGHVREGRLVPVLPDRAPPGPELHALCAPRRKATPRVRACLDWLARELGAR